MVFANSNVSTALRLFVGLALALLLLVVVAAVLAWNYEVIEKGELLPYTNGYIYNIRFFDFFDLYFERENKKPRDILNGYLLGGISFIAFTYMFLLALLPQEKATKRSIWMFLILAIAAMFLAVDELFGIHENIGHNMRFLTRIPFVTRPDDLIIALYLVPAVVFLFWFRRELVASRGATVSFAIGVSLFGIALVLDMLDVSKAEEVAEVLSGASLLPGTFLLGLTHLRRALGTDVSFPA